MVHEPVRASGYNTTLRGQPEGSRRESYAGIAEGHPSATKCPQTGAGEGEACQSNVISASSSQVTPSPLRVDFQLLTKDFFLDFETDKPEAKTDCLKTVQEGREMTPEVSPVQADRTKGQKGPLSNSFKEGSRGAGTANSTLGAVMKQSDQTKKWSEWLVRIGTGGVALHPS